MRHVLRTSFSMFLILSASALLAWHKDDFSKIKKDFTEALKGRAVAGVGSSAQSMMATGKKDAVNALFDGIKQTQSAIDAAGKHKEKVAQDMETNRGFKLIPHPDPAMAAKGYSTTASPEDKRKFDAFTAAQKEAAIVEREITEWRKIVEQIESALGNASGEQIAAIVQRLGSSDWSFKASAAKALSLSKDPSADKALSEQLKKEKDATVRVALIDAITRRPSLTPDMIEVLSSLLADSKEKTWQVKWTIAKLAMQKNSKELIDPLITALEQDEEYGKLFYAIVDTLKQLTGVDKGSQPSAWRAWHKEHQQGAAHIHQVPALAFLDPQETPPQDKKQDPAPEKKGFGTFFGVPITTKNVIFVIDHSGSMKEKSNWVPDTGPVTGGGGNNSQEKPEGDLKIDIAKFELLKAIKALPDGAMINIIIFDHTLEAYNDTMVKLDKSSREKLNAYVKALQPLGATNIFDPMEKAMGMQAGGKKKPDGKQSTTTKIDDGSADTIFLLTDGKPNNGQITDPAAIRDKIKELNQFKKITINAIAVTGTDFTEADAEFLKAMAEENFGTFVKR